MYNCWTYFNGGKGTCEFHCKDDQKEWKKNWDKNKYFNFADFETNAVIYWSCLVATSDYYAEEEKGDGDDIH